MCVSQSFSNQNPNSLFKNRKLDQPEPVSSQKNKASNSLASFLLDDEPISLEIAKTVVDNVS